MKHSSMTLALAAALSAGLAGCSGAGAGTEYLWVWAPFNIAFGGQRYGLTVPGCRAVGGQRLVYFLT